MFGTQLTLDSLVYVAQVKTLPAEIPLDSEQIDWMLRAYAILGAYQGFCKPVRKIEQAFELFGTTEDIEKRVYIRNFGSELLFARKLNLSRSGNEKLKRFQKEGGWRPIVEEHRIYGVSGGDDVISVGIATPTSIDGEEYFLLQPIVQINYEQI